MRFSSVLAALMVMLAPAVLAQAPTDDWSGETTVTVTSSLSTTLTVTKTLEWANATTTTSYSYKPTGWNVTALSTKAATTFNQPTLTAAATTSEYPSAAPSLSSVPATGAASAEEFNLALAALAGAAAMVWGSL